MNPISLEDFEKQSHQNGFRYWFAHELMITLGYENWQTFKNIINKSVSACSNLGLDADECFVPQQIDDVNGRPFKTYKLSRFACFLIVMNADDKKTEVQQAKVLLSAIAAQLIDAEIGNNDLARLDVRKDLSSAEKVMSGVASHVGVDNYSFGLFRDAGFRGMYDMSLEDLKKYKGVEDKKTFVFF